MRFMHKNLKALALIVLLTGFGFADRVHAQNNATAAATFSFQEAQSLRQAYLALARGNRDYNGHRANAMIAVRGALKILDRIVMRDGTAQQKTATAQGKAALAAADTAAKQTPTVRENQVSSDELLQQAAQILNRVRPKLVMNDQQNVLSFVDTALNEISTALKVR